MYHRPSASRSFVVLRSWDCLTPFEPTPLEAKYCVPTGRYQAKLAATWSAMAPTGHAYQMLCTPLTYSEEWHRGTGHFSLNCSWSCIQLSAWSDMHLLRNLQYQTLFL